ncbi:cyclic nucleotide-binding domain-containing protein [Thalassobaculum sp.]|jgi:CRP-like cAMP-binding protein|uniref:cyclic nucleotide-binding domain-containing protein n=1 Tax=Thalassobaculum sp. TaxID=2022740 RepID=UPI0032EE0152
MKLKQLSFDAGEIIVEPGQACQGAFLIEAGKVEVYRKVGERKIVVAVLGKGEIFGEMALIDHAPHARYVRAVDSTHCLLISRAQYEAMIEQTPPILKLFLTRVVRKLRKTTEVTFGK